MKVIIIGLGNIGTELAKDLSRDGRNQVILVDSDAARCERLAADLDALVIEGDGTNPEILKKAQIDQADALVAATSSDALNTVVAMLAKQLGVPMIIVKLNDLALRPACQEIGVTEIIAPSISAAAQIQNTLSGSSHLDLSVVERGGLRLEEIHIGAWTGRSMAELGVPADAIALAVLRDGQALLAKPSLVVEKEDVLLALCDGEETVERLREALAPPREAE